MEHRFGLRYTVRKKIYTLPNGTLYEAVDHSLQRTVLVYEINSEAYGVTPSTRSNLLRATRFSHDRFMHILDIGSEQEITFAVLKAVSGTPLVQQVKRHSLTSWNILNAVAELGKAMQDAAEEGFYGYSVCADNLWLAFGRQLMPIHYWDEADDKHKGASGLCCLLYQLAGRTDVLPDDADELGNRLRFGFRDLPPHQLESLLSLCVRTFREHLSLNAFLQGLQACLEERKGFAAASTVSSSVNSVPPRISPAMSQPIRSEEPKPEFLDKTIIAKAVSTKPKREEPPLEAEVEVEEDLLPTSGRWWKKLAVVTGAACLFVVLVVTFLTIIMQTGFRTDARADQPKANTGSASASAPADSTQTNPKAATGNTSQDNTANQGSQEQTVTGDPTSIPQLIGMTQQDAEKSAIASGLHYKFFMEANDAPKGTVFKQDPNAGAPITKGGNVTFWVSKGK